MVWHLSSYTTPSQHCSDLFHSGNHEKDDKRTVSLSPRLVSKVGLFCLPGLLFSTSRAGPPIIPFAAQNQPDWTRPYLSKLLRNIENEKPDEGRKLRLPCQVSERKVRVVIRRTLTFWAVPESGLWSFDIFLTAKGNTAGSTVLIPPDIEWFFSLF